MEQKMRQKRQNVGMVQANDIRISSAKHRPASGTRSRELHGKLHYYFCLFSVLHCNVDII